MTTGYAQTNIQLFGQLRRSSFSGADLARVARGYELAMELFAGQFRPNGKPFLCHLVGTASVLATHGLDAEVVTAGLLHAAYASGEWGDGGPRVSDHRRRRVAAAVGDEVENLVYRYTREVWNEATMVDLHQGLNRLEPVRRDVVVMRLANFAEDYLDEGMAYAAKGEKADQAPPARRLAVAMAGELGHPTLAAALEAAFASADVTVAPALVRASDSSFSLAPLSHVRRPDLAIRKAAEPTARAVKRRLRSALGRSRS